VPVRDGTLPHFAWEVLKVALHLMSNKELSRVEILRDLTAGRLTVSAASA